MCVSVRYPWLWWSALTVIADIYLPADNILASKRLKKKESSVEIAFASLVND